MDKAEREALIEQRKKEHEEWKKNRIPRLREFWNNLKPFETIDDIPDIPILDTPELYNEIVVTNLIRCGAIPKKELKIGQTYIGTCRNFSEAVWKGKEFEGNRYKWGMWQVDKINHFEDDDGYDVFVPLKEKI